MGHNIKHYVYPENVDKKRLESELNIMVSHETYQESGGGLNHPIRWIDIICEDREAAEEYIRTHDRGWYDQLAVKFHNMDRLVPTKALLELKAKRDALWDKFQKADKTVVAKEFKAQYVACKKCGSKLNREYLDRNFCPVCGNDMRSDTLKANLERMRGQLSELDKKIREEERKTVKKASKISWLIKIEWHT